MIERLFILNGRGGAGKNSFVDFIIDEVEERNLPYNVIHTSIITPVKYAAKILGWNDTKDDRSRKFLHDLKILSERYNDYCFDSIKSLVRDHWAADSNRNLIFVDMREEKDILCFTYYFNKYKPKTILVQRNGLEKKTYGNFADDNADKMEAVDYLISNNGSLEDLRGEAKKFFFGLNVEGVAPPSQLSSGIESFKKPREAAENWDKV